MQLPPLAYRMRPQCLSEYIGQSHIIGPNKMLSRMLAANQMVSVMCPLQIHGVGA